MTIFEHEVVAATRQGDMKRVEENGTTMKNLPRT